MIILDTNVVSEALRLHPSLAVSGWMEQEHSSRFMLTVVTEAELLLGAERLPEGRRKRELETAIGGFLAEFQTRILVFDRDGAREYSKIVARRIRLGRPISPLDAMIAAIAHANDAQLATRNIRDFAHCGIKLIDPWTHAGRSR